MKITKHVLLWGLSLCLLFNFSITSLATSSQAGIFFTEKEDDYEEKQDEKIIVQENKTLPDTLGDRTSSELPQTGEYQDFNLLTIGLVLLMVSIAMTKICRTQGGRKMNLKTLTVLGLVGSSMLAGTGAVRADKPEEVVTGSEDGKGGTSHGYINLTTGDTDPKDPIKPTVPPGDTGNEGVLTLDNVAPLLFSTHKLEGKEQVYKSVVEDANIQVSDVRGEGIGWNVQVSQTLFKDKVDETKVLKGAVLTLPVGTVTPGDENNVSTIPRSTSVAVNGELATILNAEAGSGDGTWVSVFNKDEITLKVPSGNKKGEYMSTVTWALMDAPK